jgi:DNA/RNA-binding domain of Phe-tRNA-synthetase-like protein
MTIRYRIAPEIFERFPDFIRGVVVAKGLANPPSAEELIASLRTAEADLAGTLTLDQVLTHPRIASWREAFRSAGIKPSEFRPSMEALTRRVLRHDPLPAINTLVDLGNLVSIRRMAPIGAHAIDHLRGDISLRLAAGNEVFEPFGADTVEHPQPGEIIFAEEDIVLTRRWTWRQARHTLVLPETTAVEVNVDSLPPVSKGEVEAICVEIAGLVHKYCGGESRWEILSKDHPELVLFE